jgi:hypothetical protein
LKNFKQTLIEIFSSNPDSEFFTAIMIVIEKDECESLQDCQMILLKMPCIFMLRFRINQTPIEKNRLTSFFIGCILFFKKKHARLFNNHRTYNPQLPAFEVMKDNPGAGQIDECLFHRQGEGGHPPVAVNHCLFKPGREELHPVAGIEYHTFL